MKFRLALLSLFLTTLSLPFLPVSTVHAQSPTPQKVIAIYDGTVPYDLDPGCSAIPHKYTVEVWNVGAAGGGNYGEAVIISEGPICNVDAQGNATPGQIEKDTFTGTFSGGPDGIVIFTDPANPELEHRVLFIDGTLARITISDGVHLISIDAIVQNPEAFEGIQPLPTAAPTPGSTCEPVISNISGLKPGDVLSPAVDYLGPDGKPVGALSSVWYINGVVTNSVTWDGNETSLILQYTCPDNSAHETRVTIPAYVAGAPAGTGNTQPDLGGAFKTGAVAGGLVAGVAGAAGAVAAGGYAATQLLRPKPSPTSRPPKTGARPVSVSQEPSDPVPPPQEPKPPPEQPPPSSRKITPEDRRQLADRRSMINDALAENLNKFNTLSGERDVLVGFFKRNTLKFVAKKGLETGQYMTYKAIDATNQVIVDPVLKKVFGMHDTSNDAKIILRIHAALNENGETLREVRKEIIHLKNEIEQIDLKLAGG